MKERILRHASHDGMSPALYDVLVHCPHQGVRVNRLDQDFVGACRQSPLRHLGATGYHNHSNYPAVLKCPDHSHKLHSACSRHPVAEQNRVVKLVPSQPPYCTLSIAARDNLPATLIEDLSE